MEGPKPGVSGSRRALCPAGGESGYRVQMKERLQVSGGIKSGTSRSQNNNNNKVVLAGWLVAREERAR